jgi:hypothetical protein
MPVDATLNPVAAPTSAALRSGDAGAFDATAFDLYAFDTESFEDGDPAAATLTDAPSATAATLTPA